MRWLSTPLDGVFELETTIHRDERGAFSRVSCAEALATLRAGLTFTQVNHSVTRHRGTVRGLHWQIAPSEEVKLVRCLRGVIFDVAVDLRADSPTFRQWHGVTLDDVSGRALLIPEGCAHGFQALTDDVHVLYQHSVAHAASAERGIRHDDPTLGIGWPMPVTCLSARDRSLGWIDGIARPLD
jgi:dTDP-4-dehydrorhamnose 3,5-epimerase